MRNKTFVYTPKNRRDGEGLFRVYIKLTVILPKIIEFNTLNQI